jgi:hypothetical protein
MARRELKRHGTQTPQVNETWGKFHQYSVGRRFKTRSAAAYRSRVFNGKTGAVDRSNRRGGHRSGRADLCTQYSRFEFGASSC